MRKRFVPEPDITAYELAVIVANVANGPSPLKEQDIIFSREDWDGLADGIKRHFK